MLLDDAHPVELQLRWMGPVHAADGGLSIIEGIHLVGSTMRSGPEVGGRGIWLEGGAVAQSGSGV